MVSQVVAGAALSAVFVTVRNRMDFLFALLNFALWIGLLCFGLLIVIGFYLLWRFSDNLDQLS